MHLFIVIETLLTKNPPAKVCSETHDPMDDTAAKRACVCARVYVRVSVCVCGGVGGSCAGSAVFILVLV